MPFLWGNTSIGRGRMRGILSFEGSDPFNRRYLGYAPGYLDLQVQWLRRQSGLEASL